MTFDEKTNMYFPSEDIINQANVKEYEELYKYSIEHREQFWAEQAEHLDWYKKWDKVLDDSDKPFYKWFAGGKINIVHNAIDRHLRLPTAISLLLFGRAKTVMFVRFHIMP